MENMIRSSFGEVENVIIVDDVATNLDFKKIEMFRSKEFLKEFFGDENILVIWAYPYLTDNYVGLLLFAQNKFKNLVCNDWRMDIPFIQDVKFQAQRRTITIKYNIPKATKGFLGRGSNKGFFEFSSMKFPTWQSSLSKILLGNQKEKIEAKLEAIMPEYEELRARLDSLQKKFLNGDITEEQHDKFAKELNKNLKNLEKQKMILQRELESLRV